MTTIGNIYEMNNGNKVIGNYPEIKNSTIKFIGADNVLYCEDNVKLTDSNLCFCGDNSIIYLASNHHEYKLSISIYNDCVFHIGKDNYINQTMNIILSEHKHCFIGDNGAFSFNIFIRNADPHLIYDCSTGKRLNSSKSVYIGDHVWIGQDARILKGTQIDSGSIVGAMSVISGKKILHNSTWAGNPGKQISNNIFWDLSCVHDWTLDKTKKSIKYFDYISEYKPGCHDDYWIYRYNEVECIEWYELENFFLKKIPCIHKCEYLIQINTNKKKNRFIHKLQN